jgi:PAS domain S-box-containing protein
MFSARSRIVFGLTSTVVSVMLVGMHLGILPDHREFARRSRIQLCESIAANSSAAIRQRDVRRLQAVLDLIVQRNADILSAAVRRVDGSVAVEVGDHDQLWEPLSDGQSNDRQVLVPIRANQETWGNLEMCFQPLGGTHWWSGLLNSRYLFVAFVGTVTFLITSVYLRRTLQHLDPSKVVPGRVRSALDTLAEGLLVLDLNHRIMLANQSFAETLGRAPEQLLGQQATELPWAWPRGPSELGFPWERAGRDGAPLIGALMHLTDFEGRQRSFMVNCTPILGNEGTSRGVLASFEDITQLEETQHELSRSKEAADAANRAKSEFLARMSHEIRTPMNAILGFTDVLRRGFENSPQERQEYLNTIHASGQHLLNLINDILDLSKVESGRLDVERIQCAPIQLIHEAVTVLRGQAERKGISLTYDAPDGLPETIATDPVRFRQLITNLVGNAIKFTEHGGVRVIARLMDNRRRPRLLVEVVDTGIGIPPDTLDKIFEPFVQADSSVTRRFGGTGLGLAISRRFAEALGGELRVRSEAGKGSVFSFMVDTGPLEGVPILTLDQLTKTLRRVDAHQQTVTDQLPPVHILVVDDGESNRKLVNLVLSRAGAVVQSARNGKEAVETAARTSFDLILMDMQMPVMDGYTAATILRRNGFTKPIIALTADAMKGTEERCREAGCTGFLTKPIDMDKLIESLSDTLRDQGHQLVGPPCGPWVADRSETPDSAPLHSTLPADDVEFCEIVAEFEAKLHDRIAAMRQAVMAGDHAELARLAHWLKGSGGTAGFHAFTDPAQQLQHLAQERAPDECLEDLLGEIEATAKRIVVPPIPAGTPD